MFYIMTSEQLLLLELPINHLVSYPFGPSVI